MSEAVFTVTSSDAVELQRQADRLQTALPHVAIAGPEVSGDQYQLNVPIAALADIGTAAEILFATAREWLAELPPEQQEVQITVRRTDEGDRPWHISASLVEPSSPLADPPQLSAEDRTYLDRAFIHHPPVGDQRARYEAIRDAARDVAETILLLCPPSRERSTALTHLETAMFWANASIARSAS